MRARLCKKDIAHQSPQSCNFELEFRNSVVPPIGLVAFAPPVQGHDTHTQRARNFALQRPLPR
jgi:hypothetical protein